MPSTPSEKRKEWVFMPLSCAGQVPGMEEFLLVV